MKFLPLAFPLLLRHFWGPRYCQPELLYDSLCCLSRPTKSNKTWCYTNSHRSKHTVTGIHAMPKRFWTRLVLAFRPAGDTALVHWAASEAPFWTLTCCCCDFLRCTTQLLGSIQIWYKSQCQHWEHRGKSLMLKFEFKPLYSYYPLKTDIADSD